MDRLPITCREYSEVRKIAVAEEKKKKYTLNNNGGFTIEKYRVDGCVAQSAGERRCDYLLLTSQQPPTAYFVELKGGDLRSAVEQIRDTIKFLQPNLPNHVYKARIVGQGNVPGLENTPIYRDLLRLLKSPKHYHYATNGQYSETI